MSSGARSLHTLASKPISSTLSIRSLTATAFFPKVTLALPVSRLTVALATPGVPSSTLSMVLTQAEQVMPPMLSTTSALSSSTAVKPISSTASTIFLGEVFLRSYLT